MLENQVDKLVASRRHRRKTASLRDAIVDALRWRSGARPGVGLPKLVVNPDRADRVEPRVRKRRPKQYPLMKKSRSELRKALLEQKVAA